MRLTVCLSLTWGSAAPQIPSYPPQHPDPQHEIAHPGTAVRPRWVPAAWDKEGSCCWFLISGFAFRSNSVLGCCPSCRWGEPSYLVGDRRGTNSASALVSDLGFRGTRDTALPPSTPDPQHQIAPPGIPVPPVRAPEKRSRSGYEQGRIPLYTLHPMRCRGA